MIAEATHERLARAGEAAGLTVRRSVPELRAHVALADCVVGMAGYNTCCDLLTFRRPNVIVPRNGPSREQTIRAERFADWGTARVLPAPDADDARLANAIAAALDGGTPPPPPVPLDGLSNAVDAFDAALAASCAPSTS
jgi:predicted glycosyltransferase